MRKLIPHRPDTGVPILWLILSLAVFASAADGKSASVLVDAQMRENAVRNVERYDWARAKVDDLKKAVAPYMEMPLEELWLLQPSQEIGRDRRGYHHGKGCPQCFLDHGGAEVGHPSWRLDFFNRPWQVQCARCREWFPKNDFHAYYESALDDEGKFRIGGGDPRYLQPMDGVEGEAVHWTDDSTGFKYEGLRWNFIGYYANQFWSEIGRAVIDLATLYTLTNEREYALRAGIMLDRLGHIYPKMDETPHYERGLETSYGPGRIVGRGHEYGEIRRPFAKAYDYIYDSIREDAELVEVLAGIGARYGGSDRSTFQAIDAHIRRNVFIEMAEDMMREGTGERGRGHMAQAVIAVALDDSELTPKYLDWLHAEDGGRLPATLIDHLTRDGFNINGGGGYIIATGRVMASLANLLRSYAGGGHDLYADYPMLLNSFTMLDRIRVMDTTMPMIGDGGRSMSMSERELPLEMLVNGYRTFGGADIAREIEHQHGLDDVVRQNIYMKDPEAMLESLKADLAGERGPLRSYNAGGFGNAVLQAPWRENPRAAAITYTRTMTPSHTHADRLTLHLWAFDSVLMPDMGFRLYSGGWPKRHGWTRHTISHNTLMINDTRQERSYSGKTRLFADAGGVRMADIDGRGTDRAEARLGSWSWGSNQPYDDARTYRRAAVMVDVDETNSYLLDLFWARGGDTHRLIQNGGSTTASTGGLSMVAQERGTLAGEDVDYGEEHDGRVSWHYAGSGFQYLKDVERDPGPAETFWIDWPIEDSRHDDKPDWGAHMRVHNLTAVDEVALASGIPSRGRPDTVRYSLRSRFGKDLSSQFISVIEPYMHAPFIENVRVLERVENETEPFAAAVEVSLGDGRRDVLLVRKEPGVWRVGDYYLDGRVGMVRLDASGEVEKIVAIAAHEVRAGDVSVVAGPAVYSGKLVSHDDSDPHNVLLKLSEPVGQDAVGQYIIFDNKEISDGSYRITALVDSHTVNIGQMSIYERLADPDDFGAGVIYNIETGEAYIIPRTAVSTASSPSDLGQ